MPNDFEAMAKKIMGSPEAAKILSYPPNISAILNSPQGKEIAAMLNGNNSEKIKKAAAAGNASELKDMVSSLLKTKEGAKIAEDIKENFKKG